MFCDLQWSLKGSLSPYVEFPGRDLLTLPSLYNDVMRLKCGSFEFMEKIINRKRILWRFEIGIAGLRDWLDRWDRFGQDRFEKALFDLDKILFFEWSKITNYERTTCFDSRLLSQVWPKSNWHSGNDLSWYLTNDNPRHFWQSLSLT